ncbi:MAG: hypothetical protein IPH58_02000 [Sphingobacteriales bacterium]|jgi:hypothetical protein|nr:hypothetical protein [Sphingobacteriales bacterium]
MKKLFAIAILAVAFVACNNEAKTEETPATDTAVTATVDTAAAIVDTAAAKVDSAAAQVAPATTPAEAPATEKK